MGLPAGWVRYLGGCRDNALYLLEYPSTSIDCPAQTGPLGDRKCTARVAWVVISDIAVCHKMPCIAVVNGICIRTSFQRAMRTRNPAIFAVRDCNDSGPNLTPVSTFEDPIAAEKPARRKS